MIAMYSSRNTPGFIWNGPLSEHSYQTGHQFTYQVRARTSGTISGRSKHEYNRAEQSHNMSTYSITIHKWDPFRYDPWYLLREGRKFRRLKAPLLQRTW